MTREEAIDILVGVIAANSEEENEALDMAVEALQTQDEPVICESEGRRTKPVTKGEYMAFKGIKRMSHVDPEEPADKDFMGLIDTITENTMASVIVIPYEAEVVSTNTSTKSTNISTDVSTEALKSEPSEDLISRAEAIEAVKKYANKHTFNSYFKGMLKAVSIIADIPSADRPRGEWLDTEFEKLKRCSRCSTEWGIYSIEEFDFCPSCGADMRPTERSK